VPAPDYAVQQNRTCAPLGEAGALISPGSHTTVRENVVLLLHEDYAPLSLIDENKLCKDELG
jgi:hypothetical protein